VARSTSQGNVIATRPDYSGYYANRITMKVSPVTGTIGSVAAQHPHEA